MYEELPEDGTFNLADGVDIPTSTLKAVLDALRSGERHKADLADIKRVISQLGSRIGKLEGLSDEDRQHAASAVYTQILKCCTTL